MKLLEKHVFLSVFLSEILSLNMLIYLVISYSFEIYSISLLVLLILTHLFCLLNTKVRKILSYRMVLVFLEIFWILYYYKDFEFFSKMMLFSILSFYFFSFLFWHPYHVLSSPDIKKSTETYLSTLPVSFVSSRLFFIFITTIILSAGYFSSWVIPLSDSFNKSSNPLPENSTQTKTGYTSEVSLKESILERSQGSSKVVLYFYLTEKQSALLDVYFPYYLLKVDSLDYFDGEVWVPTPVSKSEMKNLYKTQIHKETLEGLLVHENLREIPHPYSTVGIQSGLYQENEIEYFEGPSRWALKHQNEEHTPLLYSVLQGQKSLFSLSSMDQKKYLNIPQNLDLNSKMIQVFKKEVKLTDKKTPKEKAFHLKRIFTEGNFKPRQFIDLKESGMLEKNKTHFSSQIILETFLTENRTGFCDLFASSFALLLRSEGIPARVISGFKISDRPFSGVLAIKEKEAHAWVEAWFEKDGWIPFDPTPSLQVSEVSSLKKAFLYFEKLKDLLQATTLILSKKILSPLTFLRLSKEHPTVSLEILLINLKRIFISILAVLFFILCVYSLLKRRKVSRVRLLSKNHQKRRESLITHLSESGYLWLKQYRNTTPLRGGKKQWLIAFDEWCLLDEKLRFSADGSNPELIQAHCEKMDEIFEKNIKDWKEEIRGIQKRKSFLQDLNNIKKSL